MTAKNEKPKAEGVDLSSFDEAKKKHEDGIEVSILGPDGKTDTGLKIRIAGPDSDRAQKASEELSDELLEQESLSRPKAREVTQRGIKYLAKLTIGWSAPVIVNGERLTFSEENAAKLYRQHKSIREQIDRAAGNRAGFLKG